jgi:hypothetical protein
MLRAIHELIVAVLCLVAVVALLEAGLFRLAGVVAFGALLFLLPARDLWTRLYGGPSRHIDVVVEQQAGGMASVVDFVLITPLDDERRRALSDVAEGSGLPSSSLVFDTSGPRLEVRVSSASAGASASWETFARMGSRVSGEACAVAAGGERWLFRDAKFVTR